MKHLARTTWLLVIAAALLVSGCAKFPVVPHSAKLLYHGPANFSNVVLPDGGRIYLFDATRGRVEGVQIVTPTQSLHFSGLDDDHKYSLYWEATPDLIREAPVIEER